MPIDVAAVQKALKNGGLDGWLLYDFHGSNPVANSVTEMARVGKLATRRWFYLIPASGEPRALVHAIEKHNLDHLPGSKTVYAGREQLEAGLKEIVRGARRVAMEYSPKNAIPYVSRVDAGTIELVRALGVDVISSGDLIQQFEACWDDAAIATHRRASDKLYRIKDQAFEAVTRRLRDGVATTEYDIQQLM
ncbi:MAG: aminopeptidase P family protein, partial [Vicinamibacterales bacterium]